MNKCFNQLFLSVKHFNKNESSLFFSVSVGQPRRDARLDQGYLWGHSGPTGSWTFSSLSKNCLCLVKFWVLSRFVLFWFDLSFVKCFVATHPVHVQPNHVSLQMSLIYVYCWNDQKSNLKRTVYPKIKHLSLSAQKLSRFTRLPIPEYTLCACLSLFSFSAVSVSNECALYYRCVRPGGSQTLVYRGIHPAMVNAARMCWEQTPCALSLFVCIQPLLRL